MSSFLKRLGSLLPKTATPSPAQYPRATPAPAAAVFDQLQKSYANDSHAPYYRSLITLQLNAQREAYLQEIDFNLIAPDTFGAPYAPEARAHQIAHVIEPGTGRTLLHYAAEANDVHRASEILNVLDLEKSRETLLPIRDQAGQTAQDIAQARGFDTMANLLRPPPPAAQRHDTYYGVPPSPSAASQQFIKHWNGLF